MSMEQRNLHAKADLPEGLVQYMEALIHITRTANMADHDTAFIWQDSGDSYDHYTPPAKMLEEIVGEECYRLMLESDVMDWSKVDWEARLIPKRKRREALNAESKNSP